MFFMKKAWNPNVLLWKKKKTKIQMLFYEKSLKSRWYFIKKPEIQMLFYKKAWNPDVILWKSLKSRCYFMKKSKIQTLFYEKKCENPDVIWWKKPELYMLYLWKKPEIQKFFYENNNLTPISSSFAFCFLFRYLPVLRCHGPGYSPYPWPGVIITW